MVSSQWLLICCSSAVSAVPRLVYVQKLDFVAEKSFLLFSRVLGRVVEFVILSEQINQKRVRPVWSMDCMMRRTSAQ